MGFSLIEAALVAAFFGLLAGIAVPSFTRAIDRAAATAVVADARTVNLAVNSLLGAGGVLPPSGAWAQAPAGLDPFLAEDMTFRQRDADYRFVSAPLSGTAQLQVRYSADSPLGMALQAFRNGGEVTWTPTQTTFFLVK